MCVKIKFDMERTPRPTFNGRNLVCGGGLDQCFPVPARHRSVPFRSPSPFLLKNGTEERNGTERFQFWEERNGTMKPAVPFQN